MIRARLAPLFMVAFGSFALWQSIELPLGSFKAPGPGFFPVGLSVFILLISLTLLVKDPKKSVEDGETDMSAWKTILTFSGFVAYAFLLEPLGFEIATFGLAFFLLGVVQKTRWSTSILIAATLTLISRVLFGSLLGVSFPRGLFL
jgi:putative tricarboxylic transport membrane protein